MNTKAESVQDSLLPVQGQGDEISWRALKLYSIYRLIIAALFVGLVWVADLPEPLGVFNRTIFQITTHAYLIAALLFFIPLEMRLPRFPYQVAGQVFSDILAITLIMYASAGVSSGFGMLLMIAVAGGSLLKPGKIAYFFAAVATIAVLGEELYSQLVRFYPPPNYTHAAVLGITFFITAFICHALALRIRESEALAESRAVDIQNLALLNEQIVQHMQSGVLVLDSEGRVQLFNSSARNLIGFMGDITGRPIEQVSRELSNLYTQWREQGGYAMTVMRPETGAIDIQVTFRTLTAEPNSSILVFIEDAAMLRQRAQQLKLASLGRMAASIAHEVRNPLGAISHAGQLLYESGTLQDEDRRLTAIIQEHSRRVNSIIENVMRISRREPAVPQSIPIGQWLHDFCEDFCRLNDLERTAIVMHVEPENMRVIFDPSQLHQIMMNLCSNALRYSKTMPLIRIECHFHSELNRPYMDIMDQGSGMPDEIARHVFEPFVTSESQGTGLGLYIARELCEANQSALNLQSNTDNGCCFRITFPHSG